MKICFCRLILAIVIIALIWWNPSWAKIAITVAAAIIALMSLSGSSCCCDSKKCEEKKK
jgi:hypothetical protein